MSKPDKNGKQKSAGADQTLTDAEGSAAVETPSPTDELGQMRAKLSEYQNDLQRLAAEFDNYKKRVDKEKVAARAQGKAESLAPFLDMEEVFIKAQQHASGKNTDTKAMHDGLFLLHKQLHSIFNSAGVKEIPCAGIPHHAYHDVLLQVPGGKSGEIAQVLRKGYVMGEYVLRPAQVSVYAGETKTKENEDEEKIQEKTNDEKNSEKAQPADS